MTAITIDGCKLSFEFKIGLKPRPVDMLAQFQMIFGAFKQPACAEFPSQMRVGINKFRKNGRSNW
jgi:hypothetical protein